MPVPGGCGLKGVLWKTLPSVDSQWCVLRGCLKGEGVAFLVVFCVLFLLFVLFVLFFLFVLFVLSVLSVYLFICSFVLFVLFILVTFVFVIVFTIVAILVCAGVVAIAIQPFLSPTPSGVARHTLQACPYPSALRVGKSLKAGTSQLSVTPTCSTLDQSSQSCTGPANSLDKFGLAYRY